MTARRRRLGIVVASSAVWLLGCTLEPWTFRPRDAAVEVDAGFVATLFAEDFESYPPNTSLSGQGGWSGDDVYVEDSPNLGSRVADTHTDTGSGTLSIVVHALQGTVPRDRITELRFHAWAHSAEPESHNTGVFLGCPGGVVSVGWTILSMRWAFDARGLTGDDSRIFYPPGGLDSYATLVVVLDPMVGEVRGRWEFGGGGMETPSYPASADALVALSEVCIVGDFRTPGLFLGMEIDDIEVVVLP